MDAVDAAFERGMAKYASAVGINQMEDSMGAPAKKPVTAMPEMGDGDHRGSQNQTQTDKDDYSTHKEEKNRQDKETRQSGKEGTDSGGDQNQSLRNDDKNYTLGQTKGAALRVVSYFAKNLTKKHV